MFKNYLKTALRKLMRDRSYAIINVLGLSLGITCALIIFLIVRFEMSFDQFHSKKDRIFRVTTDETFSTGELNTSMASPRPIGKALKNDFASVDNAVCLTYAYAGLVTIGHGGPSAKKFQEETGVVYLDPVFFDMFDFEWISGAPNVLSQPNTAVLTESLAQKYFPGEDPVGKIFRIDNVCDIKVAGVVKNFPENTDFPFTLMISFETFKASKDLSGGRDLDNWGNLNTNINTYVLLKQGASAAEIEDQLPAWQFKYYKDEEVKRAYKLQSLNAVHFDGRYGTYTGRTVALSAIGALALVGLFLILTACINFINMATAQAMNRRKEIGVRKVLGAYRRQLVYQFLSETFLVTCLAVLISAGSTEILFPKLLNILDLRFSFNLLSDPAALLFLLALTIGVSLMAGLYPSLILSGFKPVLALKGGEASNISGMNLRRGLVVLQFAISQILIIGTVVVTSQMDYLLNKDLGLDKNAVLTVPLPQNDKLKLETLRARLMQNTGIRNVSYAWSGATSGMVWDGNVEYVKNGRKENLETDFKWGDTYFLETYGLHLLAGRNYFASDTIREYLVNETFIHNIGIQNPQDAIGKTLKIGRRDYLPIAGVVKDFHTGSLHKEIRPCLLSSAARTYQSLNIKITMQNAETTIGQIEKTWSETFPDFVFKSRFLDDTIANFYKDEIRISYEFRIFASIAIFVGCLGLFGLVSFISAKRTKEIGVRKVLGATAADILLLLSKEFAALIAVAFAVAAPLADHAMHQWLQDFAYRVDIGAGIFVTAMVFTVLIAAATVGYRAVKAATANPVDALKYE